MAHGPKLATGEGHGAWLRPDGSLLTWGANRHGQLGRSDDDSPTPAAVPGLSGVRDVACAAETTFAVLDDGRVLAFGANDYGQLGDGGTSERITPAPVAGLPGIVAISAAHRSVVALAADGTVWQWGDDSKGSRPRRLEGLGGVVAVARSETHGAALLKDGTVRVWGDHGAGDLGNGCYSCAGEPVAVPGLSQVAAIAAGYQLTVAVKQDGTVWTLGYGEAGQLGDGTRRSVDRPVRVSTLTGVTAVAAGYMHVLALKEDGTVWAFGDNHYGELGNPALDPADIAPEGRARPVRCGKLTHIVAVAAGGKHSLALSRGGELTGWGDNASGVLGVDPDRLGQADVPMAIGQSLPDPCQSLFSCQTASGKYIELCGEPDDRDGERWRNVTYRFGAANGPPELLYPQTPQPNNLGFFFAHCDIGGDYLVTVRFTNAGFTYRVFSGSRRGAGVSVTDASGKRVATISCIERPELFASYLWKSLPCDRQNPHGERACREKPFKGK